MKKIHLLKEPNLMAKYNAFPYQQEAFDAVKDLEYAAIFHEQGLGKTKIAIDVLLYWLQNTEIVQHPQKVVRQMCWKLLV